MWDYLFNTSLDKCTCVDCRPKRTEKEFALLEKPNYSILLNLSFWLKNDVPVEFLTDGTIKID